ncbi:jg12097, partial [Pararge aegeria aegeria]
MKSRRAARKQDTDAQRRYYGLMLKEDSDAALLRVFECFLEAAPQQVLQTTLLLRQYDHLA